jgi:hypothetical protein
MHAALEAAADLLAAGALWFAVIYVGWRSAAMLLTNEPVSVRWSGTAVVAFAQLVVLFLLMSPMHAFRLWVALPLLGTLAVAMGFLGRDRVPDGLLAEDLRALGAIVRKAGPMAWTLVAGFPVLVRFLRGLVAPPLGWDALSYHLVKGGQWVQAGGFTALAGPDANHDYNFFPPYGDILWAWAMLPVRGDALIAIAGLAVWLSAIVAAYGCARALGANERNAFAASLAIGFTPAATSLVTSAFVDNAVLATFLMGALFTIRAIGSGRIADGVLAGLALGLLAGTKATGAVLLATWVIFVGAIAIRNRKGAAGLLTAIPLALILAAPPYVRSWVETGNPVFPFPVSVAGHLIFPGNLLPIGAARSAVEIDPLRLLWDLTTPFAGEESFAGIPVRFDHLGLGPGLLVIVPLGIAGAVRTARRGRGTLVALLLILAAALVVTQLGAGTRYLWVQPYVKSVQRYLLPTMATFAVLGATVEWPWAAMALCGAAVCGGVLSMPRGVGPVAREAMLAAWPGVVVAVMAGLASAWSWRRAQPPSVALGVLAAGGLLALFVIQPVRQGHRVSIYEEAAQQQTFDVAFLHPFAVRAWPIWASLDVPDRGHRIAVAAGWDPVTGNNWFLYPLLGSRLQNEVLYVPPTVDGSVIDYRRPSELRRRASLSAWATALIAAEIDTVVLLAPPPPEAAWVTANPEVFELRTTSTDGSSAAFAFHRDRARKLTDQAWPGPFVPGPGSR